MKTRRRTKRSALAALFLRGLVTLLPVVLTGFAFVTVFQFASNSVTKPINATIYWSLEGNALGWRALDRLGIDPYSSEFLDPAALPLDLQTVGARTGYVRSQNFSNQLALLRVEREGFLRDLPELCIDSAKLREAVQAKVHPLVGALLSVLLVLLVGWTLSGFFGRSLIAGFERLMGALPIVRSVYPCAKQLVEFFLSDSEIEFESVVAVPYPRKGLWSLGFVTNTALRTLTEREEGNLVCVFVPSSPMPMTGYTIMIPADDLVPLSLSVDEALRITVSGGVLIPPREQVGRPGEVPAFGSKEADGGDIEEAA